MQLFFLILHIVTVVLIIVSIRTPIMQLLLHLLLLLVAHLHHFRRHEVMLKDLFRVDAPARV